MQTQKQLVAKYGLFTAISMVVGQVIGSGIFFKVDDVLVSTQGSALAGLLGFLIVGVSVIFASISMANYAQLIPKDGGILSYVDYRFGPKAAALVGWMYLTLFYPILTAVLFTVSGIYISHFLANFIEFIPNFLHYSLIGGINSLLFLSFNILKPKSSGLFQQLTTVIKLIPLILIAALGIISFGNDSTQALQTLNNPISAETVKPFWSLVAASFIPIAFAFDGWYIATQISGEIKNARKNLPKALVIGAIIILVVYILYYLGIVLRMSPESVIQFKDSYIIEYSKQLGSNLAALVMQLFIIISVLGTANGLMLASIRVPFQFYHLKSSRKFLSLGKINEKAGMPLKSAFFAYACILFYLFVYYLTNTLPFFKEINYDLSAIPVAFIYVVNGALFVGLVRIIKEGKLEGNKKIKYLLALFALVGIIIVLTGTVLSDNGISYLLISAIFILSGLFFLRK